MIAERFNDTRGAKRDIVNGISTVRAIQGARSVRPIVLLSRGSFPHRCARGLQDLGELWERIMCDLHSDLKSFSYVFTRGWKRKDGRGQKELFKAFFRKAARIGDESGGDDDDDQSDSYSDDDSNDSEYTGGDGIERAVCSTSVLLAKDIVNKVESHKFDHANLVHPSAAAEVRTQVLDSIFECEPIMNPKQAFQTFVNKDSRAKLEEQCKLAARRMKLCLRDQLPAANGVSLLQQVGNRLNFVEPLLWCIVFCGW